MEVALLQTSYDNNFGVMFIFIHERDCVRSPLLWHASNVVIWKLSYSVPIFHAVLLVPFCLPKATQNKSFFGQSYFGNPRNDVFMDPPISEGHVQYTFFFIQAT